MAKGPAKKVAKKTARPVAKSPAKAAVKSKATVPSPKIAKAAPKASSSASTPVQRQVAPAPAPVVAARPPAAEAIAAFERGMTALQQHRHKDAAGIFKALLDQFPTEGSVADRARVYMEFAARELRKSPSGGGSIEERLTEATLALNNHNDAEAVRLATGVLKEDASQDLAEYLLAVVASRGGDIETALAHLRRAIAINPECRLQARQDEEFDPLMDSDDFHLLIEAPTSGTSTNGVALTRRPVRKTGR